MLMPFMLIFRIPAHMRFKKEAWHQKRANVFCLIVEVETCAHPYTAAFNSKLHFMGL